MHINQKGATLNSLKISEMSLMILMHACSLSASSFGKKKSTFPGIIILIFHHMCFKSLHRDDRLLCDIEISGKTQNYCPKSDCNFKVTRFYVVWFTNNIIGPQALMPLSYLPGFMKTGLANIL